MKRIILAAVLVAVAGAPAAAPPEPAPTLQSATTDDSVHAACIGVNAQQVRVPRIEGDKRTPEERARDEAEYTRKELERLCPRQPAKAAAAPYDPAAPAEFERITRSCTANVLRREPRMDPTEARKVCQDTGRRYLAERNARPVCAEQVPQQVRDTLRGGRRNINALTPEQRERLAALAGKVEDSYGCRIGAATFD